MKWTKQRPTTSGWYWYSRLHPTDPNNTFYCIVQIMPS
jgi:hypothetical protein